MWPQDLIYASGTSTGAYLPWAGPIANGTNFPPSSHHSGTQQHTTNSFKTQKPFWYHVIEFHRDFFSFPFPSFLRSRHQVVHRPTEILGKYSASYPLCMASVLHAVGHISNFRPFCSSSCGPSPPCLSHILPRLPHLSIIWYGLIMTGRGTRAATGGQWDSEYSCQKLSGSCQLIP